MVRAKCSLCGLLRAGLPADRAREAAVSEHTCHARDVGGKEGSITVPPTVPPFFRLLPSDALGGLILLLILLVFSTSVVGDFDGSHRNGR